MYRLSAVLILPILLAPAQGTPSFRADLAEGRYLKALKNAENWLFLHPKDAVALAAKSQSLSSLLRLAEAAALAQQSLDLDPNLADGYLARGLARAGSAVQQRNFGSLRQISGALEDLRKATELDPSLQTAWVSLGLAYQQLPGLLGGSTRKALACADGLERLSPALGATLRGTVRSLNGDWPAAALDFQGALARGPADPQVVAGYLEALADKAARKALGEGAQKARLAEEARRLAPALRTSGRGTEAICGALLEAGCAEEAWTTAEAALATSDAPSLLRLILGKIAARSGRHRADGLAHLDRAVNEPLEGGSGGYPAAHWRRGQILRDLGRAAEARQAAQAALALDPKHRGAGELLDGLR